MAEEPLAGGISNPGLVARDGAHLLRPSTPFTASVHKLLAFLEQVNFEGVPRAVCVDPDGRERLQFIEGAVPTTPYPAWSQSDSALVSVAALLRRFHDASRGFDASDLSWSPVLADPVGGDVICHNDVELSNVVFRDGVAVALIDLEFVSPGRPEYDLAHLIRLCAPVEHGFDQARMGWQVDDPAARARSIADAYGLDRSGRTELMTALDEAIDHMEALARRRIARDEPAAIAAMAGIGGIEKYDRRRSWWYEHRQRFAAAFG